MLVLKFTLIALRILKSSCFKVFHIKMFSDFMILRDIDLYDISAAYT